MPSGGRVISESSLASARAERCWEIPSVNGPLTRSNGAKATWLGRRNETERGKCSSFLRHPDDGQRGCRGDTTFRVTAASVDRATLERRMKRLRQRVKDLGAELRLLRWNSEPVGSLWSRCGSLPRRGVASRSRQGR